MESRLSGKERAYKSTWKGYLIGRRRIRSGPVPAFISSRLLTATAASFPDLHPKNHHNIFMNPAFFKQWRLESILFKRRAGRKIICVCIRNITEFLWQLLAKFPARAAHAAWIHILSLIMLLSHYAPCLGCWGWQALAEVELAWSHVDSDLRDYSEIRDTRDWHLAMLLQFLWTTQWPHTLRTLVYATASNLQTHSPELALPEFNKLSRNHWFISTCLAFDKFLFDKWSMLYGFLLAFTIQSHPISLIKDDFLFRDWWLPIKDEDSFAKSLTGEIES